MKKLLLLFFALTLVSCTSDDNPNEEFHFELMPIVNINMPESFQYNNSYTIEYSYYRPTTCHVFNDLYFSYEANFRTIAVINTVYEDTETLHCQPIEGQGELEQRSFQFLCNNDGGTYIFKFWQGTDEDGVDQYLIREVPIVAN
jgi:hypothetical protein